MGIITIARQAESGGEAVADRLAKDLGLALVDRPLLERLTHDHGLTGQDLDESDETQAGAAMSAAGQVHVDYVQAVLLDLAGKEDLVLVGRGGNSCSGTVPGASMSRWWPASAPGAPPCSKSKISVIPRPRPGWLEVDRQRSEWVRQHYGAEWEDPAHYDLIVRTDRLGVEGAVAVIGSAAEAGGILGHLAEIASLDRSSTVRDVRGGGLGAHPGFVHPSEAEFAGVLDFYRIRWQYEPRSFPLAWDEAGHVTEAFTPDFYLPDLDLYLELTTLKQSLVTDKNRKIRKFRELYPDIQLKVFYGRDFRSLVQKYGLPASGPSGAGKASSPRPDERQSS